MAPTASSGGGGVISGSDRSAERTVGEENGFKTGAEGGGLDEDDNHDFEHKFSFLAGGPHSGFDAKVDAAVAEAMSSLASTSSADGATVGAQIEVLRPPKKFFPHYLCFFFRGLSWTHKPKDYCCTV